MVRIKQYGIRYLKADGSEDVIFVHARSEESAVDSAMQDHGFPFEAILHTWQESS